MWSILQGPETETLSDAVAYVWLIERDDGAQRSVRVEVAGTALAASDLPSPISEAIGSKGATAVIGVLHWVDPPEVITVSTTAIGPQ